MAAFRRLTPDDYRWVPWKNGGGMTQDLLRVPTCGDDTHWRLSIAQIDRSGPFSAYGGVDRIFMPLDGDGVRLDHGKRAPTQTVAPLEAARFDGGWPTDCALLGGPCRAFNLMLGRAHAEGALSFRRLKGVAPFAAPGAILVLYCLAGAVQAPSVLRPGDSLCAQEGAELSGDALLIEAVVRPV